MRLAYCAMTYASAKTPIAASSTDSGAATPAPLPDAEIVPTSSGTRNAIENTGPMKPTDWAMASTSVSLREPPRVVACGGVVWADSDTVLPPGPARPGRASDVRSHPNEWRQCIACLPARHG